MCMFLSHFLTFKLIVLLHSTWKNKPVLLSLATSLSWCPSTTSNSIPSQYQFCQLHLSLLRKHLQGQGCVFFLTSEPSIWSVIVLLNFPSMLCLCLKYSWNWNFPWAHSFMDHAHTTSLMSLFQVVEVSFSWSLSHYAIHFFIQSFMIPFIKLSSIDISTFNFLVLALMRVFTHFIFTSAL